MFCFLKVYYFYRKEKSFEFSDEWVPIKDNKKKLPPDIQAVFKGSDELYYFMREDNYCRRPLDVSGVGLDPPDYVNSVSNLKFFFSLYFIDSFFSVSRRRRCSRPLRM
jgi:hypothetical protein